MVEKLGSQSGCMRIAAYSQGLVQRVPTCIRESEASSHLCPVLWGRFGKGREARGQLSLSIHQNKCSPPLYMCIPTGITCQTSAWCHPAQPKTLRMCHCRACPPGFDPDRLVLVPTAIGQLRWKGTLENSMSPREPRALATHLPDGRWMTHHGKRSPATTARVTAYSS